jgi:hypothetical protein
VRLRFDPAREVSWIPGPHAPTVPHGGVQKTARRTVVSLEHGRFQACETVRQAAGDGCSGPGRSAQLAEIVPSGARYGFDLIAHVGVETSRSVRCGTSSRNFCSTWAACIGKPRPPSASTWLSTVP